MQKVCPLEKIHHYCIAFQIYRSFLYFQYQKFCLYDGYLNMTLGTAPFGHVSYLSHIRMIGVDNKRLDAMEPQL